MFNGFFGKSLIKNIIIHFGPPKTGSSAIQNWLNQNSSTLLESGFFYPNHQSDENNVSSGNVTSIFKHDKSGKLEFDRRKAQILFKEFSENSAHTMILSSEYFFFDLDVISKEFPEALIVGYVRSPVEYMESIYNQSVKRHGNSKEISLKPRVNGSILHKTNEYIKNIGAERFHLRAYNQELFPNGDVVGDFLNFLGIEVKHYTNNKVNESYCFEALEVKRWLNQFNLAFLESEIDSILQRYENGVKRFSLIPQQKFKAYRMQSVNKILRFCSEHEVIQSEDLIKKLKTSKQSDYLEQKLKPEQVMLVAEHIKLNSEPLFFSELCYLLKNQVSDSIDNKEFLQAFTAESLTTDSPKRNPTLLRIKMWSKKLGSFLKGKLEERL